MPTVRQVCDARAIAEPTVLVGNYLHDSLPCDALWIGSCAPPYRKRSTTRCNAAHNTVQRSTHQVQRSAHHGATQYNTVQQQAARVQMAACVLAGRCGTESGRRSASGCPRETVDTVDQCRDGSVAECLVTSRFGGAAIAASEVTP